MAFSNWRQLKKIDAHVHILPDAVHAANPDSDDAWLRTDLDRYCKMMDALDIERAVIMPLNDPWLMSMEFTVDAVHRNLGEMKQRYPGRFYAFADVDVRNTPVRSAEAIAEALDGCGLDGIKLHPNNSSVAADAERWSGLRLIVSHMGAFQWEALLPLGCYVDMSAILPDYVRAFGLEQTNEILRAFGADRLLFASDYPDNRHLPPDEIYDAYFDILDRMDFTEEEAEKIAYRNIRDILG